jgi:hypothetical protein
MRALSCFVLASGLVASLAGAQNAPEGRALELAMSDETAQLRYIDPEEILGRGNSEISYSLFLSEDRDVVGSAAAMMDTNLSVGSFNIRVGPQGYIGLLSEENNDVFALAFGVDARLNLARNRGLAIYGSAYWSPDVLTFGSADNLTDFMARAEAQLTDRLLGFAGYRWFELDQLDRQDRKLQNQIFVGARWQLR